MSCQLDLQSNYNETHYLTFKNINMALQDENTWDQIRSHLIAWGISGIFAWLAIGMSFYLIYRHLQNYNKPVYQRHIIRILLMVPVYSLTAWLTFRYFQFVVFFELIRGIFEAIVIFEFFTLLQRYVGEDPEEIYRCLASKSKRKFPYPLCCIPLNPANPNFLMDCRVGVLQYAVLRPLTTISALIMEFSGVYCPESMSPLYGHFYIQAITVISTALAMFFLVTFYLVVKNDIKEYKPVTKFLSVKFVIFFSFWQSLVISVLVHFHRIPVSSFWTPANVASGLQSFLICFEMFIASLLHMRNSCFGYGDFQAASLGQERHKTKIWNSMKDAFDPTELFREIKRGAYHIGHRILKVVNPPKNHINPTSELEVFVVEKTPIPDDVEADEIDEPEPSKSKH